MREEAVTVIERTAAANCCERYGCPFAAWDLRLYLDTHPDDTHALAVFAQMYAEVNGDAYPFRGIRPCDFEDGIWHYPDGPWPWEPDANCITNAACCGKGGR